MNLEHLIMPQRHKKLDNKPYSYYILSYLIFVHTLILFWKAAA
jgi:hypothetical protein